MPPTSALKHFEKTAEIGSFFVFSLYKAAIRFLEKRIDKKKNHRIAFLLPPENANINYWLEETASALKKELLKILRINSFKKLRAHLKPGKKDKILSLLDFQPPFTDKLTEDGRRIRTFKDGFRGRGGCYVIIRDSLVDLTGKSEKQIADRMYRHFYPTYGHPSIVEYSGELDTHEFKVALIEVSSFGKSKEEFKKDIKELENFLIIEFDPPGNKRKPKQEIPYVPSELEDWMKPNPSAADFLD